LKLLGHFLAALSLLLLVAAAGFWARSHWRSDYYKPTSRRLCVFTQPGALWFTFASRPYNTRPGYASEQATSGFDRQNRSWAPDARPSTNGYAGYSYRGGGFACFWFTQTNYTPPCRFTYVGVPMWSIVIFAALAPALWLRSRRAAPLPGHCKQCGYDLRATPELCPECGSPVEARDVIRRIIAALRAARHRRGRLVALPTSG
jgi:hypothetical protein